MSYRDIRDAREGFVDMDAGDTMVKWESRIIAVILFILSLADWGFSLLQAAGLAIAFMIIFPILIGVVPILGKIAAIFFSIAWAIVGYFIAGAIAGIEVGVVVAIIVGAIALFNHHVFSGIGYSSVDKIMIDDMNNIASNTAQMTSAPQGDVYVQMVVPPQEKSATNFCSACGSALNGGRFCPNCGNKVG